MPIQDVEHPGQSHGGAELAPRELYHRRIAGGDLAGGVVHRKREGDGHPRAVRPAPRRQLSSRADVRRCLPQLGFAPLASRLIVAQLLLRSRIGHAENRESRDEA